MKVKNRQVDLDQLLNGTTPPFHYSLLIAAMILAIICDCLYDDGYINRAEVEAILQSSNAVLFARVARM